MSAVRNIRMLTRYNKWANNMLLDAIATLPPEEPNLYTFEWRRDDTRPLIGEMLHFAKASISFSAPAGFN